MKLLMNLNLRTKLLILVIFSSMIPIAILGFFSYHNSMNMLQEQTSENEREKVVQMNKNLSYMIHDLRQLSMFIYRNEMIQHILSKPQERSNHEKYEDYLEVEKLFETMTASTLRNMNIYIIGLNGDRYFTGNHLPPQYDQYIENWGIFRKADQANGNLVWSTHYMINAYQSRDVIVSAGRTLKDIQTGELLGYMIIDITDGAFDDVLSNESKLETDIYLLDQQGYIISSSAEQAVVGMKFEYPFLNKIFERKHGYFEAVWEDQAKIVVHGQNEFPYFHIVSMIPLSQITDMNSSLKNITLTVALIGLILFSWTSYFLSNTLTKPLYHVIDLMQEVSKGKLDVQFKARYEDDIGQLGNHFNQMVARLDKLIKEDYQNQVLLTESELKALQAQINPHFLYNTLETVNWIAKMNKVNDISEIVVALGEMMRFSIAKGEHLVLLKEDFKQVQNYLTIQKKRYRNKFDVSVQIDEEANDCLLPSFLIQPLVENALTHGLEMKQGKGNQHLR
jgi:two-component system sensor histidine kinase YesM